MLETNNPLIINKFAKRSFLSNKFRNTILILTAAIAAAVILTINIMATNLNIGMNEAYQKQSGMKAHTLINGLSRDVSGKLQALNQVKEVGVSASFGTVLDRDRKSQRVDLATMDEVFTKDVFAVPDYGRAPETGHEIVAGEALLEELGILPKLGTKIHIQWKNSSNGKLENQEFLLVGYWNRGTEVGRNYIWVSDDMLSAVNPEFYTLSLKLKKDADLNDTLQQISKKLNLKEEQYELNSAFESETIKSIQAELLPYRIAVILVFICTIIIVLNVMQISVKLDIKLYSRMKALGATSKEIIKVIYAQLILAGGIGILVGLPVGYIGGRYIVSMKLKEYFFNKVIELDSMYFVYTILLIFLAVIVAGVIPARIACKVSLTELLNEDYSFGFTKKHERRSPGLPMIFHLSWMSMGRDKIRTTVSIFFMAAGLVMLSCVYVIHSSFDIDKYKNELMTSDYSIADAPLINGGSSYDSGKMGIPEELADAMMSAEGVAESGKIYSQEEKIDLTENVLKDISLYYEANDGSILDYMSYDTDWTKGYNKIFDEKQCMAVIYGVDGLAAESIMNDGTIMSGAINREKFYNGNYVIAQGIYDTENSEYEQPTYQVGDCMEISGNKYEIMAIVEAPTPITEGKATRAAAFNLSFFIPSKSFQDIYPNTNIRKLFINVNDVRKYDFEKYISDSKYEYLSLTSTDTLTHKYNNETAGMEVLQVLISSIVFGIGLLNLINSMVSAVAVRKREFAVMQGLGMTKKQMRSLLLFEGLNYASVTLISAYFFSIILINTCIKSYLDKLWSATFTFSLAPIIICTPIIIGITILIPLLCLKKITKNGIVDRLRRV